MVEVNINKLDSFFGSGKSEAVSSATNAPVPFVSDGQVNINKLDSFFGGKTEATPAIVKNVPTSSYGADPELLYSVGRGVKDVLQTGGEGAANATSYLAGKLLPTGIAAPIQKSAADAIAAYKADRDKYNTANPPSEGILPNQAEFGRDVGQMIATAPLMPVRAMQAISAGAKAVPYVGRLIGSSANGGIAGGIFGAATSSTNDDSLASNVGRNALYGAAAGPIVEAGAGSAGKLISGIKNIANETKINNAAKDAGLNPDAARSVLAKLTDQGLTPDQVANELKNLGPDATLGDLNPALTSRTGGLAALGNNNATNTIEGRYRARAENADNAAHDIMEMHLGPKPDYEVEKANAAAFRKQETAADYERASKNGAWINAAPVAQHIKDQLENAVGSEQSELHKVGSYLFDKNGNIKTTTDSLLKVRRYLDDRLNSLPTEGTTQQTHTYRAIAQVRDLLDRQLKKNPDLAVADAKYSKLRSDFGGIDTGRRALSSGAKADQFINEWNSASPEKQNYMQSGLRIAIGDKMEASTRGELSEAQRLFSRSSNNRKLVKLAFGTGDDVLDALDRQAKFKATEHSAYQNSLTARRHAVANDPEYGGAGNGHPVDNISPIAAGAAMDMVTGSPGLATATGAAKDIFSNYKAKKSAAKIKNIVEGSADILSRQAQHGRDTAFDALSTMHKIASTNNSKLPVNYPRTIKTLASLTDRGKTTAVIPSEKRVKRGLDRFRGVSEE